MKSKQRSRSEKKLRVKGALIVLLEKIEASPHVNINVRQQCDKLARTYSISPEALRSAYYRLFKSKNPQIKPIRFTYMFERSLAIYVAEMCKYNKYFT